MRPATRLIVCAHQTLVSSPAPFKSFQHLQSNDDDETVVWDSPWDGKPDLSVADAWDYYQFDEQEMVDNRADAETYRLLILRLPTSVSNIAELRSFRDNVTRKLAPTVARALLSQLGLSAREAETLIAIPPADTNPNPHDRTTLIDGHIASRLLTSAASPLTPAGDAWSPAPGESQQYGTPSPHTNEGRVAEVQAGHGSLAAVLETRSRRGRRRGTGRMPLAQAGRRGCSETGAAERSAADAA
jgi:hypothetical protein